MKNDIVRTGPDTLAGRYLRKWWQPVYRSSALPAGRAVPIQILGDRFTLYRGDGGRAHLVAYTCAHRSTQLSIGWVEDDTIRCRYHGWSYDSSGQCVEQPAESHPFCQKIKIASYPVEEDLGLIFAYLGDGTSPPFERWSELFAPAQWAQTWAVSDVFACNYFQSCENIMDDVHVNFVHAGTNLDRLARKTIPRVTAQETDFGVVQILEHPERLDKIYFLMPNRCWVVFPFDRDGQKFDVGVLFFYVPIDDVSHLHLKVLFSMGPKTNDLPPDLPPLMDRINDVLSGRRLLDEFIGHPQMVPIQDGVVICGQGPIADRSAERLGQSDRALIMLREVWTRELGLLAAGRPTKTFQPPRPEQMLFSELYNCRREEEATVNQRGEA